MRISYREIIREAWEFTQNSKRLILIYAFFPAVLTTLAGMLYMVYQYYAVVSSPLVEDWERSFTTVFVTNVIQIIRENFSWTWPIIVFAAIILLLYFLIPSFCEGAIIQLVARKRNGQKVRARDGIRHGLLSFLPIFEYSLIAKTFSFVSILTWSSFIARNLSWSAFETLLPVVIIVAIVGAILTVLFTYTEFFIVIDDRGVIESITKSSVLVVTHLEETLLLSVLMLIISIRILLQIVFVLLIPAVVAFIIYLFTSVAIPALAIIVGGVIGLILLYLASYLSSIIHVFAASVWTFTFLELTHEDYLSAREKEDEQKESEEEK